MIRAVMVAVYLAVAVLNYGYLSAKREADCLRLDRNTYGWCTGPEKAPAALAAIAWPAYWAIWVPAAWVLDGSYRLFREADPRAIPRGENR